MNSRLLLALALCCLPGLTACGSDDGNSSTLSSAETIAARTAAAGGAETPAVPISTVEPVLDPPASQFTVLLEDVGLRWYTDIPNVWEIDKKTYAESRVFTNAANGMELLGQWGYLEGYETSLVPEGRTTALLNGIFEFKVETHLFETTEGAREAYQWFRAAVQKNTKSVPIGPVGNDSSGWSLVPGNIPSTTTEGIFHQVLFRRGNLVVVVQTFGSSAFMTIADAYELAQIADAKAIGDREPIAPTPTSNFTPETGGTPIQRLTPVSNLTPAPAGTATP